jgi:Protein of unknown function (DUF3071)
MVELELVRLHEDGEHLLLRAPDGTESTLPITEPLRAAVRRDRPRTGALQAQAASTLRPRDLQARLRAGSTAEELAAESGLPLEHVQRYEWPVTAEREHAIGQVRALRTGGPGDPTTLGEVADARLAARGVTPNQSVWTARREGLAPWVVEVTFHAGDRPRHARWTFEPRTRQVLPLDDEARWLGQPDDPLATPVAGVPSLMGRAGTRRAPQDRVADATDQLLDDLAERRGQRPPAWTVRRPDDAVPEGLDGSPGELPLGELPLGDLIPTGPEPEPVAHADSPTGASVVDLGSRRWTPQRRADEEAARSAHPSRVRRPEAAVSDAPANPPDNPAPAGDRPAPRADVVDHAPQPHSPGTRPTPSRATPSGRRPGRKGRAQVPSWDEIVFGPAK